MAAAGSSLQGLMPIGVDEERPYRLLAAFNDPIALKVETYDENNN